MSMEFKRRLPIPMEIREAMPLSLEMARRKEAFDAQVAAVIQGEDKRVLLIIGPCSADREDSVLDYVTRLAALQERVADKILMIPRVYTNKPRTNGTGYKGLLHNPDPEGAPDLLEGVRAIRRMHLRVVEETGMFTADEMLYPSNYQYLVDVLSYVAVGARSVENQEHRLVAGGIPVPVGMKKRRRRPRTSSSATGRSTRRATPSRTRCCAATWGSTASTTPTTTTSTWSVSPSPTRTAATRTRPS